MGEGFGALIEDREKPAPGIHTEILELIHRFGFVLFKDVRNSTDCKTSVKVGTVWTLWHQDDPSWEITTLAPGSSVRPFPTFFAPVSEVEKSLVGRPNSEEILNGFLNGSISRNFRQNFLTNRSQARGYLEISQAVAKRCPSFTRVDWRRYPNGMVMFGTQAFGGGKVLHGCFPEALSFSTLQDFYTGGALWSHKISLS